MATITTKARKFDTTIEDFEFRVRINPERNPQLDDKGDAKPVKNRRSVDSRIEVRLSGTIEFVDDPDVRKQETVAWQKASTTNFPGLAPSDINKLRQIMTKLHAHWKSQVV